MYALHLSNLDLNPGSATYTCVAHVCTHVFTYVHMCERIHGHTNHTHAYVHICSHEGMHTHAHTQTHKLMGFI